jgi:hypothetical protein
MSELSKRSVTVIILFGLLLINSFAQAQQSIDITDHFYATATVLTMSPELAIMHTDVKGIVRDNLETKLFNNMTSHCLRSIQVLGGKTSYTTYSKFTDPDGDFFITEAKADGIPVGTLEADWKFIHGTGKWKGIKGGGKSTTIFMTRGKQQMTPTTFQGYLRMTGSFELPK